ncbi:hypothetical protein ACSBR2_026673 [Camellia fascicularis]
MHVVKRDLHQETMHFEKIIARLKKLKGINTTEPYVAKVLYIDSIVSRGVCPDSFLSDSMSNQQVSTRKVCEISSDQPTILAGPIFTIDDEALPESFETQTT